MRRTRSICCRRSSAKGDAVFGKCELKGPGGRSVAQARMLLRAAGDVMKSSFSGGGTPILRTMSSSWCWGAAQGGGEVREKRQKHMQGRKDKRCHLRVVAAEKCFVGLQLGKNAAHGPDVDALAVVRRLAQQLRRPVPPDEEGQQHE